MASPDASTAGVPALISAAASSALTSSAEADADTAGDARSDIDYVIDGGSERLGFYRGRSGANVYVMLGRGGEPGYSSTVGSPASIEASVSTLTTAEVAAVASTVGAPAATSTTWSTLVSRPSISTAGAPARASALASVSSTGTAVAVRIHAGSASRNLG